MHKEPVLFLLFMTARRVKTRRVKARMETDSSPTAVFAPWMLIYNNHSSPRIRPPASNTRCDLYSTNLLIYSVPSFGYLLLLCIISPINSPKVPKRRVRGAGHTKKNYPNRNVQEVHLLLLFRKITSLIQLIFGLFS